MSKKQLPLAAALLTLPLVLNQPASAAPITYAESVSLSSNVTNQPSFQTIQSFTNNSLSNTVTQNPFFTGVPKSSGSGAQNSTVTAVFTFSDSIGGHGSLTETGTFSAEYVHQNDWIVWSGEVGGITQFIDGDSTPGVGGVFTDDVTLSDGAMIEVKLFDANDWNIEPKATFNLMRDPTPAPEPASIVLLASALAASGLVRRRRNRA